MSGYPLSGLGISRLNVDGVVPIFKFGRNKTVGTTLAPVALGGFYRMPLPANAQRLRVRAGGDPNDTLLGTRARTLVVQGLAADGSFIQETINLAGASASALTTNAFWRLYRMAVGEVGTYETLLPGGGTPATRDIIVEDQSGNEWGRIAQTPTFRRGQSEIGCYTILDGWSGYLTDLVFSTDVAAKTDFFLMKRQNNGGGYKSFRVVQEYQDVSGVQEIKFSAPLGPFGAKTDICFFARASSGTVDVQVQMDIILVRENQALEVFRT